jgi:hypothetical protein
MKTINCSNQTVSNCNMTAILSIHFKSRSTGKHINCKKQAIRPAAPLADKAVSLIVELTKQRQAANDPMLLRLVCGQQNGDDTVGRVACVG